MGYTTDFKGSFKFNKPLEPEMRVFLSELARTRRMKRKVGPEYGVEGEFYIVGPGFAGQGADDTVIDHNSPPRTQPSLWLHWVPTDDGTGFKWDGGEKFYHYVEWLDYLIEKILAPKGYTLSGEIHWQGEDSNDRGILRLKDNEIKVLKGRTVYDEA